MRLVVSLLRVEMAATAAVVGMSPYPSCQGQSGSGRCFGAVLLKAEAGRHEDSQERGAEEGLYSCTHRALAS